MAAGYDEGTLHFRGSLENPDPKQQRIPWRAQVRLAEQRQQEQSSSAGNISDSPQQVVTQDPQTG